MTDVKTGVNPLFLRDEELLKGMELLFYAYQDFTQDPDKVLSDFSFGRAHHRVIHFVAQNPGVSVAQLLIILRITKQSLSRVLKQLICREIIIQKKGMSDRRQRLLYLTETGQDLFKKLSELQKKRIARAYREAGAEAVEGYLRVLKGLITQGDSI